MFTSGHSGRVFWRVQRVRSLDTYILSMAMADEREHYLRVLDFVCIILT